MLYLAVKTMISAVLIVAIGELAKRSPLAAGLIASIPLLSLLAIVWLYVDTRSVEQVSALSWSILLMILPSLLFLIAPAAAAAQGWRAVPACGGRRGHGHGGGLLGLRQGVGPLFGIEF